MTRTSLTFTISVPPEMASAINHAMKREHRTRSELIREALRGYFDTRKLEHSKMAGERVDTTRPVIEPYGPLCHDNTHDPSY